MNIKLLAQIYLALFILSLASSILLIGKEKKADTPIDALIKIIVNIPIIYLLYIISFTDFL